MKSNTITRGCLRFAVALAAAAAVSSVLAAPQSARVIKLQGMARYSTGNNFWMPVKVGTELKTGSVIQTASESSVDLLLSGEDVQIRNPSPIVNQQVVHMPSSEALQTIVRLRDNTLLAIDKLTMERTGVDTVSDMQLDLRAGRVFFNVKKTSAASRFEIKLPNGVAGIRGSIGEFAVGGPLTMYLGSAVVTYVNPANPAETITKVINAGQHYDLTTDTYRPVPMEIRQQFINQAEEMSLWPGQVIPYINDPTVQYISSTTPNDPKYSGGGNGGPVGPQN